LTIVPPAAIQRGPQGTFVYVVTQGAPATPGASDNSGTARGAGNAGAPSSVVNIRQVTVDITEGDQAGISAGLQPGETVVIDGMDKLQDGSKVDPHTASQSPTANSSAAPGSSSSSGQSNRSAKQPSGKSKKSQKP